MCDFCPICLDKYNNTITLKCGHKFNTECLIQIDNSLCPLCRQPFDYEDFGNEFKKICYGNHIYGYSPSIKNGPCRLCYGLPIKIILKNYKNK